MQSNNKQKIYIFLYKKNHEILIELAKDQGDVMTFSYGKALTLAMNF